ncbi:diguanylate cyclase (GGDEF) domain-containing protein [Herbaspirillum sp. CF444]|uniref:diguanylate cyclase domain-containing protein n=1 Tax=Herbaspirillum sp. CF444 TaxID=1144319 RepID=UPI0002725D8E|nr:diguanylate cyclase [Herbaspirillum sp. CF444]EJL88921.1 diguanylate cyclase (GGDEF) domain-containing protein [Herbaspirillum sp. CF444]
MNLKRFANSLVTRLVLFGTLVVLASGIARYYVLTDFLHDDLTGVAAEQQSTIASYLAQDINHRILERRRYLEQLAASLPPELMGQPERLREWLRDRQELQPLFSQGLFVANDNGVIIIDYPSTIGRTGLSISGYPDFHLAKGGRFIIGEPLLSPASQQAIIPMMAPLRDHGGRLIGILGGTTSLTAAGFLDHLQQARLGESGSFILVSPAKRVIIAANDPTIVLKPLPQVGVDPLLDKAVAGYRGTGIGSNGSVEEIKAIAPVPSTGWFVVVRLPVSAALPTVEHVQAFILRGGAVQALVIFLLIILVVVWFFRPLRHAADQAERMTRGDLPLTPLQVARADEVGHLTMAFNRLLSRLKVHQAELQHQAHHDTLTGLPNRVMLADRMKQAIAHANRERTGVALLFLDLDGFKPINDTLGHKAGDQVLQEITQRLLRVARHSDTLARVGGDEFVLLATDLDTPLAHGARALAEKCIHVVAEPLKLPQGEYTLGVSIGIAVCESDCDPDLLLQAADKAMYDAKNKGRGCYVIAVRDETRA